MWRYVGHVGSIGTIEMEVGVLFQLEFIVFFVPGPDTIS